MWGCPASQLSLLPNTGTWTALPRLPCLGRPAQPCQSLGAPLPSKQPTVLLERSPNPGLQVSLMRNVQSPHTQPLAQHPPPASIFGEPLTGGGELGRASRSLGTEPGVPWVSAGCGSSDSSASAKPWALHHPGSMGTAIPRVKVRTSWD